MATDEVRGRFYAGVELKRQMGPNESFNCIDKTREPLGYAPQHSWREVLPDPQTQN